MDQATPEFQPMGRSLIWGMLINSATSRYHPICFRRAPMPGLADVGLDRVRYKSAGHHMEGFETEAEARQSYAEQLALGDRESGRTWLWDGEDVPAMVEWFAGGGT